MPVRKRVDKRRQAVTDEHEAWLIGHDKESGFVKYLPSEELAALWDAHAERIVAEHVALYPGTRPERWWKYSAPRMPLGTFPGCYYDGQLPEPRRRLGGIGTPASDVLAYVPTFSFGIPSVWVTRSQAKYYSGVAVDIRGNPIGGTLAVFDGVAIDHDDPPTFESQATYLKRHSLFLTGEERRLKKADWESEAHSL
jgi:hypothetical protein